MHHIDRKDDKPRMPTKVTPNVLRRVLPRLPSHSKGSTQSAWLLEHLRQALLDGQYASGSRLNEVHLSKELQVSRTPIRAALHVLAGEGLLRYHATQGIAVRAFPPSEVVVAYDMRARGEGFAARRAAERGLTEESRRTLELTLAEGDTVLSRRLKRETQRAAYAKLNAVSYTHLRAHETDS